MMRARLLQASPMSSQSFTVLDLRPELLATIAQQNYAAMTPIQAQALPALLAGQDLIAQAMTGSGKTAAFAIGLLNKLDAQRYCTQALVLCPTRELAEQVATEVRKLASAIPNVRVVTLCGGKPMGPQLASLQRDPHIVVGTPGRILKHIEKQTLQLSSVQTLVLDEGDRMLDMGFFEDITQIISSTPVTRQTLLFSATYPDGIRSISRDIQRDPVEIRVEAQHSPPDIEQVFIEIERSQRQQVLFNVIAQYQPESTVVFCNTKQQCRELADALRQQDLHALALHGDLEQAQRDQVLTQFAGKSSSILIATDVAARGLDIDELSAVINYELSRDPEVHVHRIGRTARAGSKGIAVSLFTDTERRKLRAIEEYQGSTISIITADSLVVPANFKLYPPMVTLCINGGRKEKVRAGDVLGALTANGDIAGTQIGKITLFDRTAYVAVEQSVAKLALLVLNEQKLKGRQFKARRLR